LRDEVKQLETKHKPLDAQCRRVSLAVAKRKCLEFAESFQAKIPPELREVVYTYVWDKRTLRYLFGDVRKDTFVTDYMRRGIAPTDTELYPRCRDVEEPWSITCKGERCECFMWWELPLWVQPQFVGLKVAREVAAVYYTVGPSKHFGYQGNLGVMLSNDLFHLGIKPTDHLRRLELDLDDYRTQAKVAALEEHLHGLLELRFKKGFDLVIKTRWHSRPRKTLRALDKMLPVIIELKQAGANVRALGSHSFFDEYLNVPDILALTSEQWIPTWRAVFKKVVLDRKLEFANPTNKSERIWKRLWAKFERYLDAPEWTGVEMDSDVDSDVTSSSSDSDSASDEE
jgi:hypothetical protein